MAKETFMDKPADAAHPMHDLLRQRWSPRAYSEQAVKLGYLQSSGVAVASHAWDERRLPVCP